MAGKHVRSARFRKRTPWALVVMGLFLGMAVGYSAKYVAATPASPGSTGLYKQPHGSFSTGTGVRLLTPPITSILLNVAPQSQEPQLPNGCEVTSLSMLLSAVGHPVSKMVLAREQPLDPTKRVEKNGRFVYWGDPNKGFVGSVYVWADGYGIYHGPLTHLLNSIVPGRALDLTGKPFNDILRVVASGTPVEAWTTTTFYPTSHWLTWQSPEGRIRATLYEHAVLIVGYNQNDIFINNPLNGEQAQAVNRKEFILAWRQLGRQAITVRPAQAHASQP